MREGFLRVAQRQNGVSEIVMDGGDASVDDDRARKSGFRLRVLPAHDQNRAQELHRIEMAWLASQDRALARLRCIEIATLVRRHGVEQSLLNVHFDSKTGRNSARSKESTIAPQQLSFCECHEAEKIFAAVSKPRLTRGFSGAG